MLCLPVSEASGKASCHVYKLVLVSECSNVCYMYLEVLVLRYYSTVIYTFAAVLCNSVLWH